MTGGSEQAICHTICSGLQCLQHSVSSDIEPPSHYSGLRRNAEALVTVNFIGRLVICTAGCFILNHWLQQLPLNWQLNIYRCPEKCALCSWFKKNHRQTWKSGSELKMALFDIGRQEVSVLLSKDPQSFQMKKLWQKEMIIVFVIYDLL